MVLTTYFMRITETYQEHNIGHSLKHSSIGLYINNKYNSLVPAQQGLSNQLCLVDN